MTGHNGYKRSTVNNNPIRTNKKESIAMITPEKPKVAKKASVKKAGAGPVITPVAAKKVQPKKAKVAPVVAIDDDSIIDTPLDEQPVAPAKSPVIFPVIVEIATDDAGPIDYDAFDDANVVVSDPLFSSVDVCDYISSNLPPAFGDVFIYDFSDVEDGEPAAIITHVVYAGGVGESNSDLPVDLAWWTADAADITGIAPAL